MHALFVPQVLGPRFDVLLVSYETVLRDRTELKKISYEVGSRTGHHHPQCQERQPACTQDWGSDCDFKPGNGGMPVLQACCAASTALVDG